MQRACIGISRILWVVVPMLAAAWAHGASFDTGLSPEATRDLLVNAPLPGVPAGSWLRLRDMERSSVPGRDDLEDALWAQGKTNVSVAGRRAALHELRDRGYRLVALLRWPADSWKNGVRPDQPLRRLPLDLREAYARCRQLATTYGDLIDYWEIENEPDISFVEENPETYAAFLKACYLGIKAGKPVGGQQETDARGRPANSEVLNAAFALPPGPYFAAWLANDGLRYSDGFNYHYYGYAEDFTGVYRQFQAAVAKAAAPATATEAVLQTHFYPSGQGWQARTLSRFAANEGASGMNRGTLQSRPLASEEPRLQEQGRWFVSAGTTVKETARGWEFAVTRPADEPLRPAMAELPVSDGWTTPNEASLAFEYRVANAAPAKDGGGSGKSSDMQPSGFPRPASSISYPPLPPAASHSPAAPTRELPVFLTEYGYGLLDKDARKTTAGREAQRVWFAAVRPQLAALKIDGAMAFVLRPYLEAGKNEFGLLLETALRETTGGNPRPELGKYAMSRALAELLAAPAAIGGGATWTVATPPPVSVVMDMAGGTGLQMSKSHRGYVLQGADASAQLVLYHFGSTPISGELVLDGGAWALAGGGNTVRLTLVPGERREIPLAIRPGTAIRFGAQPAIARFVLGGPATDHRSPLPGTAAIPAHVPPPAVSPPSLAVLPGKEFEVYFRMRNGNLYQTWPRLQACEAWQWYVEPLANFTPAFYGRAHQPAPLTENKPAALVFFFRPEKYPATYVIRHAQVVEYVRGETAKGKQ